MPKTNPCIHKLFEQRASDSPEAIAVNYLNDAVSYKELNYRSNYLAEHLVSHGVRPGDIVALLMSRSVELVVSMLAILKSGAAYLPIEASTPASNILMYFSSAKVNVLITNFNCESEYCTGRTVISALSGQDKPLFNTYLESFQSVHCSADDKAYIMFTSGSTGNSKGVVVPHRAVIRLVKNTNYVEISASDAILQFAPPSFDASTFEFWGALLNGARLVIYSGDELDPNLLKNDIKENGVTIAWLTAALFHLIANLFIEALKPIQVILAGGDVLNVKFVKKVIDEIPNITVVNGYGPTENTTFTCCHVMTSENRPQQSVPIGRAISGTEIYVLDDTLKRVEPGQVGELYTSGEGVALGYLNETNNSDSFFVNKAIASGLIYKTGDLVKENSKGEIEFIGRKDNQIKVRGYRVSMEEIRNNIVELKQVSDALVIRKDIGSGDQLLIAYVQVIDTTEFNSQSLFELLSVNTPKYMIPDRFVISENLPVNKNGKIDKNALINSLREY